jgi:hypothetical protein
LPKRGIIKSPFNKGGLRGIWGAFSGENDIIKNLEKRPLLMGARFRFWARPTKRENPKNRRTGEKN